MPGGRPSRYKPEFAEQAVHICRLGATDAELADIFRVGITTIKRWQVEHPEFRAALKAGKDEADARVERSLFQRAVGYEFDAVKIFMPAGAKAPVYAKYREHCPPDTTAQIFWLKNRQTAAWRDVQYHARHANLTDDELDQRIRAIAAELDGAPAGAAEPADGEASPGRAH